MFKLSPLCSSQSSLLLRYTMQCVYFLKAITKDYLIFGFCVKTSSVDAITISETITHSLTHSLTGVGSRRCYRIQKIVLHLYFIVFEKGFSRATIFQSVFWSKELFSWRFLLSCDTGERTRRWWGSSFVTKWAFSTSASIQIRSPLLVNWRKKYHQRWTEHAS